MSIENRIIQRLNALVEEAKALRSIPEYPYAPSVEDQARCSGWIASAKNAVHMAIKDVAHPYRFSLEKQSLGGREGPSVVGAMGGILQSLLEDARAGMISSVTRQAQAELSDDFLQQAEYYLKGGKVPQAGVVAGVVFEDTVRRLCRANQIPEAKVDMEQLITALVKSDLLTQVKATRARAAASVRTQATHAQWSNFTAEDVRATVDITRELIEKLEG